MRPFSSVGVQNHANPIVGLFVCTDGAYYRPVFNPIPFEQDFLRTAQYNFNGVVASLRTFPWSVPATKLATGSLMTAPFLHEVWYRFCTWYRYYMPFYWNVERPLYMVSGRSSTPWYKCPYTQRRRRRPTGHPVIFPCVVGNSTGISICFLPVRIANSAHNSKLDQKAHPPVDH